MGTEVRGLQSANQEGEMTLTLLLLTALYLAVPYGICSIITWDYFCEVAARAKPLYSPGWGLRFAAACWPITFPITLLLTFLCFLRSG